MSERETQRLVFKKQIKMVQDTGTVVESRMTAGQRLSGRTCLKLTDVRISGAHEDGGKLIPK